MRQKKPLESMVTKYIDFLQEIHTYAYPTSTQYRTIQMRIKNAKINKSVLKALIKLEIIHLVDDNTWTWLGKEPNRELSLEVLNFCLELKKKQIVIPITGLDAETKCYIKAIHDHLISNSQNKSNVLDGLKTPMLSKALNQIEPSQTNHLFSQVETNEAKRFELLKAVTSGVYSIEYSSYEVANDFIIEATDDLFNKFFKK